MLSMGPCLRECPLSSLDDSSLVGHDAMSVSSKPDTEGADSLPATLWGWCRRLKARSCCWGPPWKPRLS